MSLTTVARVKKQLEITDDDSGKDIFIAQKIERVTARIRTTTGRYLEYKQFTELHDGDGLSGELVLNESPVDTAAAFTLHDDSNRVYDAGSLIAAADYTIVAEDGIVRLDGGARFTKGRHNIQVVYSAGYKVVPEDLEDAVIVMVASEFIESKGQLNVNVDQDVANRIDRMAKKAQATIDNYIRFML